jgi:hypothetical protein
MVLPKVQKKDDTYFPTYIYNLLRDYVSFLKSRNIEDYIVNTIVSFNKKMELALKNYYLGYQVLAYNNFSDAMKIKGYDIVNSVINLDDVCYYRARVNDISNSSEEFSKEGMFHVPFESRSKIETQRYSIAGLPCLYLGKSAYVCWLEMGKPNLDSLNIALIEKTTIADSLQILDLSLTTAQVKQGYLEGKYDEIFIRNYLMMWPLIALCSIEVKEKKGAFKPEYIIPQLLMQWIRESNKRRFKVDGIKYFTVNVSKDYELEMFNELYLKYPRLFQNIVLPVQETKESGYCSYLSNSFVVKQTISGKSLQFFRDNSMLCSTLSPEEYIRISEKISLGYGNEILYAKTLFCTFESFLNGTIDTGSVFLEL